MFQSTSKRFVFIAVAAVEFVSACSSNSKSGDLVGTATIAITNAPPDGTCIEVTAEGYRSVTQRFDVSAGQSTVFTLAGLPVGTVIFDANAFADTCSDVAASEATSTSSMATSLVPTWVSDPVTASVAVSPPVEVTLFMHRNGRANVSIDFGNEPPDGGPTTQPQVIVSGASGVATLAVDQTGVFWSNVNGISSAPLTGVPDGGAGKLLVNAFDESSTLAIQNGQVYFTLYASGLVESVPESGGSPTTLANNQRNPTGILAVGNSLFWWNQGAANGIGNPVVGGALLTAPTTGVFPVQPTTVASFASASTPCCSSSVLVSGTRVYFAIDLSISEVLTIFASPISGVPDGGAADIVFSGAASENFFVDSTGVYVLAPSASSGAAVDIVKVPLTGLPSGGQPTVIVSGLMTNAFASDGANLYWNDNVAGRMMKAPNAGLQAGAQPQVVAVSNETQVTSFAFDATYVYWANFTSSTIVRAPK
jgi:hypothetical protein